MSEDESLPLDLAYRRTKEMTACYLRGQATHSKTVVTAADLAAAAYILGLNDQGILDGSSAPDSAKEEGGHE